MLHGAAGVDIDDAFLDPLHHVRADFGFPVKSLQILNGAANHFGLAFGFGHDWSPSEVVQQLRDEGLFKGSFNEISWTRQGWQLRTI